MERPSVIPSEPSRREGIEAYRRALASNPADCESARALFSLQLESKDLSDAEETLAYLQAHFPGAYTLSAQARLHCAEGSPEEALGIVRQLCFVPPEETAALDEAAESVSNSRKSRDLEALFFELLAEPGVNPEVGAWWVRRFVARRAWGERISLYELDVDHPVGQRAYTVFIQQIVEHERPELLKRLIKNEKARLRAQDHLWAAVGFAFVQLGQPSKAVKWLSDWGSRENAAPSILSAAALAFQASNRPALAIEVSRRALELKPDSATPHHRLWIAFDDALAGRVEAASCVVDQLGTLQFEPYFRGLLTLTAAVLAVRAAPPAKRKKIFKSYRVKFAGFLRPDLASDALKPSVARALQNMASLSGERYNAFWMRTICPPRPAVQKNGKRSIKVIFALGWLAVLAIFGFVVRSCSTQPETPEAIPLPELELKPAVPLGTDNPQPIGAPAPATPRPVENPGYIPLDNTNPAFGISPNLQPRALPEPDLPPAIPIPPPRN